MADNLTDAADAQKSAVHLDKQLRRSDRSLSAGSIHPDLIAPDNPDRAPKQTELMPKLRRHQKDLHLFINRHIIERQGPIQVKTNFMIQDSV